MQDTMQRIPHFTYVEEVDVTELEKLRTKLNKERITIKPELNMAKMVDWKERIIDRLSNGVEGLLKKNKVKHVKGWANFSDAKNCTVETADGTVNIKAEHVILANGSTATELPFLPFSENVISSTEALKQQELPNHLVIVGAGYIGLEMGIAYR